MRPPNVGGGRSAVSAGGLDEGDDALPVASRSVATAGGVAALWAGTQLGVVTALVSLLDQRLPPAMPSPWYAAALLTATGLALVSGGTLRPTVMVATLRSRDVPVAAGVAAGVVLLVLLLGGVGAPDLPPGAIVATVVLQVPLVAAWWRWAAPTPAPELTRRGAVSSLVIAVIVGHAALVPVMLHDAFPFAIYPMYSQARLDPYEGERVVFVADEGTADERAVGVSVSRVALLDLARDGRLEDLESIAASLAEQHGADEVRVYLERVQVVVPPGPPDLEVASRTELVVADG